MVRWLRKRKLAAGSAIRPGRFPAAGESCTLTIDNSAEGRYSQPAGFVEFSGELTEEQVRQFRKAWQELNGPCVSGSALEPCTCDLVIYSEHRCSRRGEGMT